MSMPRRFKHSYFPKCRDRYKCNSIKEKKEKRNFVGETEMKSKQVRNKSKIPAITININKLIKFISYKTETVRWLLNLQLQFN